MSKKKMIVKTATMTVDGTVDLDSALTVHIDSVVKAIENEEAVTLAFTAGSDYDNGKLDESAYPAIVFYFKTGVTTVLDFENAVTASQHMAVVTPGTPGDVFLVGDDDFAATALASGTISAALDACVVDVSDMTNISVFLNQLTDAGTVTLKIEKSVDGTNWAVVDASTVESDFPSGNNKSIEFPLSDANGMPTLAKQIKVSCSALATGVYSVTVAGLVDA